MRSKRLWLWYGLSVAVIALDQLSKWWAGTVLADGAVIVFPGFFRLELAHNTGAAFSLLHDAGGWQRWLLSGLALAVSAGIAWWMAQLAASPTRARERRWELAALSLILGGAIGNLYDRLSLGHVVDFVVWHYYQYHWPTFNIADAAICVGAVLLIIDMLFVQPRQTKGRDNPTG